MTDKMPYDLPEIQEPENQPSPTPEAPTAKFTVKESLFALIFSFAGYFFIKLFLFASAGIGSAIYMLCLSIASAVFARLTGAKQSKRSKLYFAAALLFSINIGITSNGLIQFLNFVYAAALLSMWAFSVNNPAYKGADDNLVYCFFSALFGQSFGNFGKCPSAIIDFTKRNKSGKNIGNVIIGLVIAVPVTITVTMVLCFADDNFSRIMESIMDGFFANFFSGIMKYVFGLPLSFLIFGIIYGAVANKSEERINALACERKTAAMKIAPAVMMYSSVVPLCIVYMIFFFSQLSYFVSAFGGVLPEEFSASEYARKGFFELCAVAVINLAVIIFINLFCKYKETESGEIKRPTALKFFTVVLSVFTIILIATALSKMIMYISRFGFTPKRIYTTWFMLVLTILFVLIILRQFKRINLAKIGTIIFSIALGALSFCQTDAVIAQGNISFYKQGIITNTNFRELSADAVYAVLPQLESDDIGLKNSAENYIFDKWYEAEDYEWYEMSLSEIIAVNNYKENA